MPGISLEMPVLFSEVSFNPLRAHESLSNFLDSRILFDAGDDCDIHLRMSSHTNRSGVSGFPYCARLARVTRAEGRWCRIVRKRLAVFWPLDTT